MKLLKGTIMWAILVGIISGCGSLNRIEEETKLMIFNLLLMLD